MRAHRLWYGKLNYTYYLINCCSSYHSTPHGFRFLLSNGDIQASGYKFARLNSPHDFECCILWISDYLRTRVATLGKVLSHVSKTWLSVQLRNLSWRYGVCVSSTPIESSTGAAVSIEHALPMHCIGLTCAPPELGQWGVVQGWSLLPSDPIGCLVWKPNTTE